MTKSVFPLANNLTAIVIKRTIKITQRTPQIPSEPLDICDRHDKIGRSNGQLLNYHSLAKKNRTELLYIVTIYIYADYTNTFGPFILTRRPGVHPAIQKRREAQTINSPWILRVRVAIFSTTA
jgi:hypothetical protein